MLHPLRHVLEGAARLRPYHGNFGFCVMDRLIVNANLNYWPGRVWSGHVAAYEDEGLAWNACARMSRGLTLHAALW